MYPDGLCNHGFPCFCVSFQTLLFYILTPCYLLLLGTNTRNGAVFPWRQGSFPVADSPISGLRYYPHFPFSGYDTTVCSPLAQLVAFLPRSPRLPFLPEYRLRFNIFISRTATGRSYSTINTMRFASLISVNGISNHPLIRRFCKGANVLKPQKARYDFVWDPAPGLRNWQLFFRITICH